MSKHTDLMRLCEDKLAKVGVKQQGGKRYMMVKDRMSLFRETYGLEYGVCTTILHSDDHRVCVHAEIIDSDERVLGSGLAEELRGGTHVNKGSALENCESSAIGRALASLGLHGGEYPTFDELESDKRSRQVIDEQPEEPAVPKPAIVADEIPFDEADGEKDWPTWAEELGKILDGSRDTKALMEVWTTSKPERHEMRKKHPELHHSLAARAEKVQAILENKLEKKDA